MQAILKLTLAKQEGLAFYFKWIKMSFPPQNAIKHNSWFEMLWKFDSWEKL